jgi:hypothetical protein
MRLGTDYVEGCYAYEGGFTYELRRLVDGVPNWAPSAVVRTSGALAFAFEDDAQDEEQNQGEASVPAYPLCLGGFVRQGLSPGWLDVRYEDERQQFLVLDNLTGTFALVVRVNPEGAIHETTLADNTAWVGITITRDEITPIP